MPDGTQQGCLCTGAESVDCAADCPFAGRFDGQDDSWDVSLDDQ